MMSKESWENIPLSSLKIKMEMVIDDEHFAMGIIIDDYKDLELKKLMDEIERKSTAISRRFAAVFAGRKELRIRQ